MSLGDRGLGIASFGWGVVVGGTTGAGIILLSMLMAAGLEGGAVIATDAAISVVIGLSECSGRIVYSSSFDAKQQQLMQARNATYTSGALTTPATSAG